MSAILLSSTEALAIAWPDTISTKINTPIIIEVLANDTIEVALDAIIVNFGQVDEMWKNNGSANFTATQLAGGDGAGIAFGDLDGDGDLDAIKANTFWWPQEIWKNGGNGDFTISTIGSSDSRAVALGDLDSDGDLDAIVANYGILLPPDIWGAPQDLLLNDGNGNFTVSSLGGGLSYDVALGDLDGDSDLDAIVVDALSGTHELWWNDGLGNFSITTVDREDGSLGVALGDLDKDGDLDAILTKDGPQELWSNSGGGIFTISTFDNDTNSENVALGDLDDDGDLDAIITNIDQPQEVYKNDGQGNFTVAFTGGGGDSRAVAIGDLDKDSDLDAIIANAGDQPEEVWQNDGSGEFTITTIGGAASMDVALVKLDAEISAPAKSGNPIAENGLPHKGLPVTFEAAFNFANIQIISEPANGTTQVNLDGTITYLPNPGFIGQDSFTYEADAGSALVTIAVVGEQIFLPLVLKPK